VLSYRHGYHAGNHADVLKHLVLTRLLTYLARKDKPLCYIESHAGPGLYRLDSPQAQQNLEYDGGIGRLWDRRDLPAAIEAYLGLVRALNPDGNLRHYPGSPWIARQLLRPVDRLVLHELHSSEIGPLRDNFAGDRRVQVIEGDGYRGLVAALPPRERRGLVLLDPAYEVKSDYRQVAETLALAHRRFATGVYVLWYPVVEGGRRDDLERAIARSGIPRIQRYELGVRPAGQGPGMGTSGLMVVNAPWVLMDELRPALAYLADVLGELGAGHFKAEEMIGTSPADQPRSTR
jgi:23S rRNA (adenine2030-N6)-methyltransferase